MKYPLGEVYFDTAINGGGTAALHASGGDAKALIDQKVAHYVSGRAFEFWQMRVAADGEGLPLRGVLRFASVQTVEVDEGSNPYTGGQFARRRGVARRGWGGTMPNLS